MPHASSPVAGMVTISLGVAAGIPALPDNRERLLKEADAATAGHQIILTHDYFSFTASRRVGDAICSVAK